MSFDGRTIALCALVGVIGCSGDRSPGEPDAAAPADAAAARDDAAVVGADAVAASADAAPGSADAAPGSADAAPGSADAGDAVGVPAEIDGQITINEFMAFNAATVVDDTGVASDWVELHNPTGEDIPLGGYLLTDNLAIPGRGVVPPGVVLPAGGYLVFWLDHAPALGPMHLGFRLAREGGDLALARPDGSDIDRLTYGEQQVDFSAARAPDGSDHWQIQWHPSPGAANPSGPGVPVGPELPMTPPESVPAAGDLSELILGYDVLLELELIVAPADVLALEADPFVDVPGHLVYDGRTYGPVGVRLKGQNSFQPFSEKPSLRINIDEYIPRAKFFGLKDLTLNNMDNDFSMMHERLAYLVARQAGVPASRANHALVTVNGEPYGLYTNVETVKRRMVTRWFADPTGPLFEGTDVDFTPGFVDDYEHEAGPDDRSLLSGLAAALTIASPDDAIAAASVYADMARFQQFWAMASVIGQFDAMPYSSPGDDYLVYADPITGLLSFIPWGMDETFYSASHDVLDIRSVLAQKCLGSPACFQAYVDETWALLAMTEAMDLEAELDMVAAQIAPYVALDTRKPYSTAMVFDYQAALGWFVAGRRTELTEMLPPPSP